MVRIQALVLRWKTFEGWGFEPRNDISWHIFSQRQIRFFFNWGITYSEITDFKHSLSWICQMPTSCATNTFVKIRYIFIIPENFLISLPSEFLTPGKHYSNFYHRKLVIFVLEFYLNGITWYLLSCGWLFAVSVMFLRVFHAIVQISSSFFLLPNCFSLYDCHKFLIYCAVDSCLDDFVLFLCLFLPLLVKLLRTYFLSCLFLDICFHIFLVSTWSVTSESQAKCVFNFIRNCLIVLQRDCTILYSHQSIE